jgi:WD40 repeat protein
MHRLHVARLPRGRARSLCGTALLALALASAACRDHGRDTKDPDKGQAKGTKAGDGAKAGATAWRKPGAGHTANIDLVVLSSDGKAVVTRDQIGGTRLWPALDGSIEPVVIPVQGPQQVSVETRPKGGFTVAAVDSAGGAKIFGVEPGGKVTELGSLAPFQPLFGIYVLPGGERLLGLFRDHSIRLVDRSATELASLEERRFRPTSLRLAADGKSFAAVVSVSGSSNKAELQRLRLVAGEGKQAARIERVGTPRVVESANALTDTTAVMSPDGRRFAVVDKPTGTAWELILVDLEKDGGADTRLQVQMPSHIVPNIGFVSEHELLVSAHDGSLSWLVDLEDASQHARSSAPMDFVSQGRAQALAHGVQAAGHGTWLFVHDVVKRSHRYLGYRSFQTQSVAISPSGEHVIWAYMSGPVFVEPLRDGTGERVELPSDPSFGTLKVRFFDDEHAILVDGAGGVRLYHWRDETLVDETGIHGAIRAMHFEPERGVMLIERHNNDVHLFEVSPKGFRGPYIVADQSFRAGLLAKGAVGHEDAIMWTLDSGNKLRHYTLEELRKDPSQDSVMAKGDAIPPGKVAPLAIDRFGRHYGVRWNGSTMELFVDFGRHLKTQVSATGDISTIVPSPSGDRFVSIHQRGQSTSLSMHDSESLEERWSFSTGVFNNEVVWSPDGRYVAVAASTGAVVLDAKTGKPVQRRCGVEFESSAAAPASAFNSLNLRSMCED